MSNVKLQIFYLEALRQRASKAKLLAELMLAPNQKDDHQKEVNKLVQQMLNPHRVGPCKIDLKQLNSDQGKTSDWDLMRRKRR